MGSTKPVRDRAVVIDESLETMRRWGVRLIVFAISLVILGWIVSRSWVVLYPISIALIVSTVLSPPVSWLRRKGWPS
ncbi:MAG: rane protein, partial [Nocardioidaceae bacterium]|nr:rane protein [Nocardioidaceae bacterium]